MHLQILSVDIDVCVQMYGWVKVGGIIVTVRGALVLLSNDDPVTTTDTTTVCTVIVFLFIKQFKGIFITKGLYQFIDSFFIVQISDVRSLHTIF
jgi:hypothetical protein